MKRLNYVLALVMVSAMIGVSAQSQAPRLYSVRESFPGTTQMASKAARGAFPKRALSDIPAIKNLPDLRGAAIYYAGYGNQFESINYFDATNLLRIQQSMGILYEGGGVEQDGEYFSCNKNVRGGWDTHTWDQIYKGPFVPELMCCYDVALDPVTEKVYGLVEVNGTRYWGTLDYIHGTVQTLKENDLAYYALGFTSEGECYGIQHEGYFGKVNKATGEFTKISDMSLYGLNPGWIGSGCIDVSSNRFFWNCVDVGKHSYVVEIDLATGKPIGLRDITGYEFYSLWAPTPAARPKAPAAVTNLKADFKGGLSGTVSFKTPEKLFDGTSGSGSLSYSVLIDNQEVATASCQWGQNVSVNIEEVAAGEHFLKVRCLNDAGRGAKATQRLFLGADNPSMPENVKAKFENDKFTVTWSPVTTGAKGGYIDPSEVTYTVKVKPGNEVVATVKADTTVTFSYAAASSTQYHFEVTATYNELSSQPGISNNVVAGAFTPPYSVTFENQSDADVFTIINVNGGKTWQWNSLYNGLYLSQATADDWAITPGIYLEGGKAYYATFEAASQSPEWKEQIEAFYGTAPTVEAMTNSYVPKTIVTAQNFYGTYPTFGDYIIPEKSGIYYIGYHGCSVFRIGLCMVLRNIQVAAGIDARVASPDKDAIKIVPDIDGALNAAITVKVPTTNMFGKALEGPLRLSISRGEQEIVNATDVNPGDILNFTDQVTAKGRYDYVMTLTNAYGTSADIPATAYFGINLPAAPQNVEVSEDIHEPGKVTLTWPAVTADVDGNPIKSENFTYTVTDQNGKVLGSNLTEPTLTVRAIEEGKQDFMTFSVMGVSAAGNGPVVKSGKLPIGTPYEPEHIESFNHLEGEYNTVYSEYPFYWIEGQASTGFYLRNYEQIDVPKSSEEDLGIALYNNSKVGDNATMVFPKVSFKNVAKPALSFKVYRPSSSNTNLITVNVICNGDTTEVCKKTIDEIATAAGTGGNQWATCPIELDQFAGKEVYYTINMRIVNKVQTCVDHIRAYNNTARDMAIQAFEVPSHAVAGKDFDVSVKVINRGALTAKNYILTLMCNGQTVETVRGDSLTNMQSHVFTFPQRLNALSDAHQTYSASIEYADDEALDNNKATSELQLTVYDLPQVAGFTSEAQGGDLNLSWQAPVLSTDPKEETQDFEEATPWSGGPEGWQSLDMDLTASGYYPSMEIPTIGHWNNDLNTFQSSGFFVFNNQDPALVYDPELASQVKKEFGAHSGVSFIASMFARTTDDWLVLPELCGEPQTISFYGVVTGDPSQKGQVEVRYCPNTFTTHESVLLTTLEITPGEWVEYHINVPDGVKWIALRNRSTSAPLLKIDDVSYKSSSDAKRYPVQGYCLYRNSKLIYTGTNLAYTDKNAPGDAQYAITVVYPQGESRPLELSGATGLSGLGVDGQVGNVYDLLGREVMHQVTGVELRTLPAGVYIWRGQKILIK